MNVALGAPVASRVDLDAYLSRLPRAPSTDRSLWIDAHGRVSGRFFGCNLSSVFEPVVTVADGGRVAYEALVRSYEPSGIGLSPWRLFELAADDDQLIGLDRLCRTVHALNFFAHDTGTADLHLNVHGRLVTAVPDDHGRAYRQVLASLGLSTERIVIDLPPSIAHDDTLLAFTIANYRWNGFRVALALTSPERVLPLVRQLQPEFTKVPLSKLRERDVDILALAYAVATAGSTLIVTNVEATAALGAGAQEGPLLAQGKAWGSPMPWPNKAFTPEHRRSDVRASIAARNRAAVASPGDHSI